VGVAINKKKESKTAYTKTTSKTIHAKQLAGSYLTVGSWFLAMRSY